MCFVSRTDKDREKSWPRGPKDRTERRVYYWVPARAVEAFLTSRLVKQFNAERNSDPDIVLPEKHGHPPVRGGWWD